MAGDAAFDRTTRIVGWTFVYGLNIILPAWFGAIVCKSGGLVGMIAGIFAFYAIATFFVIRFPRFGTATIRGGFLFAFTQFTAIPQMYAGLLAVGIWNSLIGNTGKGIGGDNPLLSEVGGFACTIMTGQPLFALAVGLGYIINSIVTAISGRRPDPTPPDDE